MFNTSAKEIAATIFPTRAINKHLIIITIIYSFIGWLVFSELGVKYVNDSPRYLEYAHTLRGGFYFDPHNFWYIGYAIFISLLQFVSSDYLFIVMAQYLVGYCAVLALYRTSMILFTNQSLALFTACIYMAFIEITTWHSYLLAESLYVSLVCVTLYFLARLYTEPLTLPILLKTIFFLLLCTLTKPTGIALSGAFLCVVVYHFYKQMHSVTLRFFLVLLPLITFLLLVNKMLSTFQLIENYQLGEVIYGVRSVGYDEKYPSLVIDPPGLVFTPPNHYPPLLRVISFIAHHPVYWLRLFITKLFFLIVHVRPFWSLSHNLFSISFLIPQYIFFAMALRSTKLTAPVKIFIFVYIGIQLLSIGLTSEDWDGRFLMPLLPVIFLLSGKEIFENGSIALKKYLLTSGRLK